MICYGISERLLPGLLHFARSVTAGGRLEQPLTYWNAMGEVAALGLVLCARIAGDHRRPRAIRIAATAAAAPLGMGLYLTYSRGALFACLAGLIALIVLAPSRRQLRAMVVSLLFAALAGSLSTREAQGAVMLALLVVLMVGAGLAQLLSIGREQDGELRLPARAGWIAFGLICATLALAIVVGAGESSAIQQLRPGATRYATVRSNRYAYWKVALRTFGDEPLRGVGAGGWAVYWLRYRTINDFA